MMQALMEVTGEDVIGRPGQELSSVELLALVGLADGVPAAIISEQLSVDDFTIHQIERAIQGKLGAKNRLHMITRGFTLGVLIPRALCVLLCLGAALEADHDFTRPRSNRRSRSSFESARVARLPSHANAGRALIMV